MSKNAAFAAAVVAGLFASGAAMADDLAGWVDVYHVILQVGGGRLGCIQFRDDWEEFVLPGRWGCVYGNSTDMAAKELSALLREAALLPYDNPMKKCRVFWDATDNMGFAIITAAECGPRHCGASSRTCGMFLTPEPF